MSEAAANVRFEPCAAYRKDSESAFGCCVRCGWLEDDHELDGTVAEVAVVARLPVSRRVERRAS